MMCKVGYSRHAGVEELKDLDGLINKHAWPLMSLQSAGYAAR